MKSQNAKFFCENCGAEVPQNARMCRHCGRFFSSVRCPVCGMQGPSSKFTNGCPSCGYAIGRNGEKVKVPQPEEKMASRKPRRELMSEISSRSEAFGSSRNRKNQDGSLPAWMLAVLAGVLVIFGYAAFKYLLKS